MTRSISYFPGTAVPCPKEPALIISLILKSWNCRCMNIKIGLHILYCDVQYIVTFLEMNRDMGCQKH